MLFTLIQKGSCDVDNALDIIGLVSIINKYPQLASKIRPAGKVIDGQYCTEAQKNAIALLQLKGYVIVNGVPQNNRADYLNRLITVCLDNQAIIKEFASAAYCNDPDYYNANFTSKYRKSSSDDDDDDIETVTDEDTDKHPIEAVTITDDTLVESASEK